MIDFFIRLSTLILTGFSLIVFFLVLEAYFSARVDRTRQAIDAHPRRAFLIGLVNALFFGSIVLGLLFVGNQLLNPNLFTIPAMFILIPLGIGVIFGVGGMIGVAGDRLFPDHPRRLRNGLAAALIYIACLAPFAGWFALTGYLAITGLGGFILGFLNKE